MCAFCLRLLPQWAARTNVFMLITSSFGSCFRLPSFSSTFRILGDEAMAKSSTPGRNWSRSARRRHNSLKKKGSRKESKRQLLSYQPNKEVDKNCAIWNLTDGSWELAFLYFQLAGSVASCQIADKDACMYFDKVKSPVRDVIMHDLPRSARDRAFSVHWSVNQKEKIRRKKSWKSKVWFTLFDFPSQHLLQNDQDCCGDFARFYWTHSIGTL